jgi:glycosyltransferase involved in cell wall biosynthesis
MVLSAFGGITPEKRIEPILQALAVTRRYQSDVRLLLVGQAMPHFDALAAARALGVDDLVTVAGYVDPDALPSYLAASDVVLSMRWPSARETSASWLRAIAAGRPTVITDLAQQVDVPTLDPRSWTAIDARPTLGAREPVAVSIDILDEAHSLTLALKRLATDGGLRARLGSAALSYWAAEHTVDRMASAYDELLRETMTMPERSATLPAHLRPDAAAHARDLIAAFPEATRSRVHDITRED